MKRAYRALIALFATFWILKEVVVPVTAAAMYSRDFMQHAVRCDAAMEADWYNRQVSPEHGPSDTIQLFDCHAYDKTRKVLLMSGLPEAYLSWLGLKALEIYQRPASEFAQAHRFRER